MSPFEMNYGMTPSSHGTIGTPQKCPSVTEFLAKMRDSLELAKSKLQQVVDRAKFYDDQRDPLDPLKGRKTFSSSSSQF